MYASRRGFSLIEIMSTMIIMGVLALISSRQYGITKAKSRKLEAKTQLALLQQGEQGWLLQHGTYTSQVGFIMFPKGRLRYNVGFSRDITDFSYCQSKPRGSDTCPAGGGNKARCIYPSYNVSSDHINNTLELCGNKFERVLTSPHEEPACAFQDQKGEEIKCASSCSSAYRQIWEELNWRGTDINQLFSVIKCQDRTNQGTYLRFDAFAVGEIKAKNVNSYTWNENNLDVWMINEAGILNNCNDPLEEKVLDITRCEKP